MTERRAFGQSLRRRREERGIPLETIASVMKVSPSMLAALERGDCSRWPGGIYSRACVRQYAKAIGLDPSEVAARFAEHFADTAHPDGVAPAAPAPRTGDHGELPLRLTLASDSADRAETLLRRARFLVMDVTLVLAAAASVSTISGKGFWIVLAVVSLTCQAIAILRGAPPASSALAAPLKSSTVPVSQATEHHGESVAAQAT